MTIDLPLNNTTREVWSGSNGYFTGYQFFDPDTGALIYEGPHVPLTATVAPGAQLNIPVDVEVPPHPGGYRIFVSLLHPSTGWLYNQNHRFTLVDADVAEDGACVVSKTAVTTVSALRSGARLRSMGTALTAPLLSVWKNRKLIRTLVQRDILSRYRGSFGGVLWTLLNPLLLMVTYFFVFGVVLQSRFAGDSSRSGFALYFLAGMLPWLAFSEAAGRAPVVLHENKTLIKKVVFPVEILPVDLVAAGLVSEFFGLCLFLLALVLTRGGVPSTVVWLPVLIIPQLLFTAGVAWLLAALGAFVRDLAQIMGFLLTLWFFLTPICYPETQIPASAARLLLHNPIYQLVRGYRAVLLEHQAPAPHMLVQLWIVALLFCIAGHALYRKLRHQFADAL